MNHELSEAEIEQRLGDRPDLMERLRRGELSVLAELFEVGIGAKVVAVRAVR